MIISNYHWRPFFYRGEIPGEVLKKEFDYLDEEVIDGFFKYRGEWYHLSDFTVIWEGDSIIPFPRRWQGYLPETHFSGLLIEVSEDLEAYRVASYCI